MNQENVSDETISRAPDARPAEEQPTWRRDFPIDWSADDSRARRGFLRLLMLTSLAFVVGQFWIVLQRVFRKARGTPPEMAIASADELSVGASKVFRYPGPENACVLVCVAQREYVAFGQKCTHLSCPVLPRPSENRFYCPCHDGSFDLRTGRQIAGPPRRPLPRVKLEVRGGTIFATGIEGVV